MDQPTINPDKLRETCIRNQWFTCGSNEQYERMFMMNDDGAPIYGIALVIYICSEANFSLDEIEDTLRAINDKGGANEPAFQGTC